MLQIQMPTNMHIAGFRNPVQPFSMVHSRFNSWIHITGPAVPQARRHTRPIGRQPSTAVQAFFKGFSNVFSTDPSEKTRKKYEDRVAQINALEPAMQQLSNEELCAKTEEFRQRAAGGETLDGLLVEAFAVSTVSV